MIRKVIKAVIKKKMNEWFNSIEDKKLKELVKKDTIVTGGAIVSMLLDEELKDFDVYFKTQNTAYLVASYYAKKFNEKLGHDKIFILDGAKDIEKQVTDWGNNSDWSIKESVIADIPKDRIKILIKSSGIAEESEAEEIPEMEDVEDIYEAKEVTKDIEEKKKKYRPVFFSGNAITLSDKIQLVTRFHGEPEEIHKNYDYIHCTCTWTSIDNKLNLPAKALESILTKQLYYQGSLYPVCSIMRMRKFIKRGWNINAGQILKMVFQASQLDLTNISVLEDQLIGVDSAYFMNLIDGLKYKIEGDENFELSSNYINVIIDKIFE